ncbi:tRNA (adenosine(37)-N6)-threonylcarbamoyltransferase complex ATPase subunit type 1 TsaE [Desmospora profundinema]|uniref:tRNA threonylcarbamoyladenosine biosynthesis protein TsaE n=1 Tax=Desmospora profundinema TaxID=1571184 RepID=A0ABU1IRW5_9BACL|nr:tRNA (adenosine(37)-N6)-threonylcarbamoyltransferase complex ATPase subunit type 1 TsaE [Desmospora profundinema]MDR6227537.1 tRNA threonylcarbamoyladenosine biosynthesis protein TsaE [Desmospora profundinema]
MCTSQAEWVTHSPEETKALAARLAARLCVGDVLTLEGDLGAGKTTFSQGLARGLGIADPIDSPTFTLIKEYHEGRIPLYHMDAYRLEGEPEELGWDEYFEGAGICLVEWASRIEHWLPEGRIAILIRRLDENSRHIQVRVPPEFGERLLKGLSVT